MASATEQGSTILNKIIIPVITTILGATAIYFLGFNKKSSGRTDMEQMLISKDATVKAWKSFVTAQNVDYKNEKSLGEEFQQKMADVKKQARSYEDFVPVFTEFEKDIARERRKTTQDVETILKDPDIDRDFISMLNRILDDSKDYDKKLSDFFDNITSILKSGEPNTEKKIQEEVQKYIALEDKMGDRIINQAESIAKILADRYNQAFDLNELLAYVELKKEKEKKTDQPDPLSKNDPVKQAPIDPNDKGSDVKQEDPPSENGGTSVRASSIENNNSNNTVEPAESLLTGQWSTSGSTLELSKNGKMFWVFDTKGYTSGDWKLVNGKLQMNATNPDTKQTSLLIGYLTDVTRNSFTLTFMTTPREVYHMTRKN